MGPRIRGDEPFASGYRGRGEDEGGGDTSRGGGNKGDKGRRRKTKNC